MRVCPCTHGEFIISRLAELLFHGKCWHSCPLQSFHLSCSLSRTPMQDLRLSYFTPAQFEAIVGPIRDVFSLQLKGRPSLLKKAKSQRCSMVELHISLSAGAQRSCIRQKELDMSGVTGHGRPSQGRPTVDFTKKKKEAFINRVCWLENVRVSPLGGRGIQAPSMSKVAHCHCSEFESLLIQRSHASIPNTMPRRRGQSGDSRRMERSFIGTHFRIATASRTICILQGDRSTDCRK